MEMYTEGVWLSATRNVILATKYLAEDLIGLLSLAAFSVNCSMIQAPMQKVSENTELEIAENDEEWQHEQVALAAETDRLFHMTCFGSIATPWFAALQRRR